MLCMAAREALVQPREWTADPAPGWLEPLAGTPAPAAEPVGE